MQQFVKINTNIENFLFQWCLHFICTCKLYRFLVLGTSLSLNTYLFRGLSEFSPFLCSFCATVTPIYPDCHGQHSAACEAGMDFFGPIFPRVENTRMPAYFVLLLFSRLPLTQVREWIGLRSCGTRVNGRGPLAALRTVPPNGYYHRRSIGYKHTKLHV